MKKVIIAIVLIGTVGVGGILGYSYWKSQTSEGFYDAGKRYYDEKKYSEAIISFLNSVRKDSRHRDSRYYLALSYLNKQQVQQAVAQLRALLETYPDDAEANLQLGRIFLAAGSAQNNPQYFKEAQTMAEKVLTKQPDYVPAMVLSANSAVAQKDLDRSVEILKKATSIDPKNSEALISLGTAFALQKNTVEAEKALLQAREANPKDKAAMISLGNYYRATGDAAKAEATLKEAFKVYPTDRVVYGQLADFYARAGRFSDGIDKLDQERRPGSELGSSVSRADQFDRTGAAHRPR